MIKSITEQYDPAIFKADLIAGALKECKIFSTLTEVELMKISPLFKKLDFEDGEYIFFEEDPSDWLYIVTQDRVKTIKHTQSGRDIILEINSPGDMVGCATVLNNKPYSESAQAKGDVTVIRISHKNFRKIIDDYPSLKTGIANYINNKLNDAYEMLKNISTETVEKRIILILFKHSDKTSVKSLYHRKINFTLTRRELAEMAGTSVETCCRIMSKFQKQGIVNSSRKKIFMNAEPLNNFLLMNKYNFSNP